MAKYNCKECDNLLSDGEEKSCDNCGIENPCHRCDCCTVPLEKNEGFWIDGEINTKKQKQVYTKMKQHKYIVICDSCFNDNLKLATK